MCRLGGPGWAAVRGRSGRCRNTLFTNFPDAAAAGSARSLDGVGGAHDREATPQAPAAMLATLGHPPAGGGEFRCSGEARRAAHLNVAERT